ncbi:hypothetical protein [Sphingomonas faeni]|uniref:hypothetical protein n=1 Tax=Sphingomonas faeni TaxID=185950 RepID=UPI002783B552|nr:hypothetical protein [Sphingomonas faeni]MDQ0839252.1 hypothetical protein [Sphingomonas faeni]
MIRWASYERLPEALKAVRGRDYALFGLGGRSQENLSPSRPLLTTFHTLYLIFASNVETGPFLTSMDQREDFFQQGISLMKDASLF